MLRTVVVRIVKQYGLLLLATSLALMIRLWNLKYNPLWYIDEGSLMNVAWNTIHGHPRLFGVIYAFTARAPLSSAFVGAMLWLFGYDILILRYVSAVFGGLSTFVIGLLGSEVVSKKVGIMTGALYAILPLPILFSRWGFADYNMLTFMLTVTCLVFLHYFRKNGQSYLVAGSLVYSLAILTNYLAISLLPGLLMAFFAYDKRKIANALKSVGLIALFPAIFVGIMLLTMKEVFLLSLGQMYQIRVLSSSPYYLENIVAFVFDSKIGSNVATDSYWIPFGLIGTAILSIFGSRPSRILGLFTASILFLTLRFLTIRGPDTHEVIHLYPYMAIGFVFIGRAAYHVARKIYQTSRLRHLVVGLILVMTVGYAVQMAWHDYYNVAYRYRTNIDLFCLSSPMDIYDVANWINDHTSVGDVVIASHQFAGLVKCNLTDLLQATVAAGYTTWYYPVALPPSSFAFNCSHTFAKYMTYDGIVDSFYRHVPYVCRILNDIFQNWKPVYFKGEFIIFENPRYG